MPARRSFINSAVILMVSGLVVRLLGFVYRIYVSNMLGSEAMGIFQLISPVYSLIILTLTSGVSIAISRMVSRETARRHIVNVRRITVIALLSVFAAGMLISLFMLINARLIANEILKDPRTYYSVLLLVPCIPVIALSSTLKGFFYGIQEVTPNAWSQIAEQVTRIVLVLLAAKQFINNGLEYACAFATAAMAAGEIASLLVLYLAYRKRVKKYIKNKSKKGLMRKRAIILEILKISWPVSSNRFITSIMSAIELILIPRRLLAGGMDYQASIETYGKLTGMAMPLVYFPALVTSSLAVTLVPAISEALSLRNFKTVTARISKSIQVTLALGFIFFAVFMCYHDEIGNLIFRRENIGELLYLLSFACIPLYFQQTLSGILNGLGKQGASLRNSMIGYLIRIGFVYFCIPVYGIKSYTIAILASSILTCLLNLLVVTRETGMAVDIRNWMLKPGIVAVSMLLTGRYIHGFFATLFKHSMFAAAFSVIASIAVGIFLMVMIGVLEKKQLLKAIGLGKDDFHG
ncbi:MAG: stage V sporulation protein B [Clostridiaceae bacterium]|nr:stage V sporulation protein B [Clostridiaceae bacterium]